MQKIFTIFEEKNYIFFKNHLGISEYFYNPGLMINKYNTTVIIFEHNKF